MSIQIKLPWIAVILWMVLIFFLSHQPASESSEVSSGITEFIMVAAQQIMPTMEEDFGGLEHIVRKNAHFFIYLILGILVIHAFRKSNVHSYKGVVIAIAVCILFAMSDELHQLFVPGRSGEIRDVFIDSSGGIVGIILYRITEKLFRRNTSKVFNKQEVQG